MRKISDSSLLRYALAILVAIIALLLRVLLTPLLGDQNAYHTAWLAIVFSSWYFGLGPSVVTTLVCAIGVAFWFIAPQRSFAIVSTADIFGLVGFLILAACIITLGESNRRVSIFRSRLAALVDSSDDAVISKDLNGVITSWNRSAQHLFGFTSQEAVGQSITLIVPPELQAEEKQILARLRNGERIEHFETIRRTKSGSRVHVSLTISPVRDAQGSIVGASKIARDITERGKIAKILKESELSARLLQAQEDERRHIARELHDGVGQLLVALSMNSAAIAREKTNLSQEAQRCVLENVSLIGQVSGDIRTVSYLLHPPVLDHMGLLSALEWYVEGFSKRSNIKVTLDLPPELGRLPRDAELSVFRIVQESLSNVHRHSGSQAALVRLSRAPGEIKLEVRDEGRGIDQGTESAIASGKSAGVGLRGIQERVKRIGGTVEIYSNGKGTTVMVSLPVVEETLPETTPTTGNL